MEAHPGLSGIVALPDGHDAFAARALLADAAERTLDARYYIWHNDMSGSMLFSALRRAADRGVQVRLLLDDNNTAGLDPVLAALLAQSPYVYQDIPSLRRYLAEYPHAELEGAHEVLFWATDSTSGLKPILSVTHLISYAPPELPGVNVVASKQIYANHYFEGAFDLAAIVDRAGGGGKPGIYLVLLRRFRFDNLPSGGIVNIRGKVVGKLRDQMRVDLARQKASTPGSP